MKNKYEIRGDVTVIFVYHKGNTVEVLIDTDDLEKASTIEGKWSMGTGSYIIHKTLSGKRTTLRIHRVITNAPNGTEVDHVNHNRLDNRKINLRVVSKSVNLQNLKSAKRHSSTRIRNVSFHKKIGKYQVKLQVNKKSVHGGYYESIEEATEVAKKLRAMLMEGSFEASNLDFKGNLSEVLPIHKPYSTNKGTGVKNVYYVPKNRGSKKYIVMFGKKYHGHYRTLEEADEVATLIRNKQITELEAEKAQIETQLQAP